MSLFLYKNFQKAQKWFLFVHCGITRYKNIQNGILFYNFFQNLPKWYNLIQNRTIIYKIVQIIPSLHPNRQAFALQRRGFPHKHRLLWHVRHHRI